MSGRLTIPPHVRNEQVKASDPCVSVWVSANAGAGKTHVLAQRVLRLLLAGTPPAKILCLTFTKAAAANMAERIFGTLSTWTALADDQLADAIVDVGAPQPTPQALRFARRLFARTVETPGGLKTHTIHGFCERLLHLFPFEANVPARFEVLDDLGKAELLREAQQQTLAAALLDAGELGGALQRLAIETSEDGFDALIAEAIQHRSMLRHYTLADAGADLGCALDLPRGTTLAMVEAEMIEHGIAPQRWRQIADILDTGSKTDCDKGRLCRYAAEIFEAGHAVAGSPPAEDHRRGCLAPYLEIFFGEGGFGPPRDRLLTKALATAHPDLLAELLAEQQRLDPLRERRKAAVCFENSLALVTLVGAVFARYENLKGAHGRLDFDDLIERTLALFERSDARWVLYKLDAGIDHVLVDEAQDTSPAQWKILEALVSEFCAGAGSGAEGRTFFAVGDEKQSIFSFQGAAPHMFHAMRQRFAQSFRGGGKAFEHVPLKHSFRSAPAVLQAVDQVFAKTDHQKGLVTDDPWMDHEALKQKLPGLIEIWAPVAGEDRQEPRDWTLPLDMVDDADPASLLAQRVARKIAMLLAPGANDYVYDGKVDRFRPVAAGDILVLVRKRGPFFEAMIRALKQHLVPVAGADRLDLLGHIAVMDLIAAGRAALLPQDDLTVATVLKSPLIGLDDHDLLALAPGRRCALFEALGASAQPRHRTAHAAIRRWISRVALSPFDFYARLLSEDGGRRAIEARLGPEACDAMDEFLRLALHAERDGAVSLPIFLAQLDGLDLSIKRDMETSGACVRVMTVHAAKGLEAKIVFLPDTCGAPTGQHDPKIHVLTGTAESLGVLAWSPRKADDPPAAAAARQKARDAEEEEHRRLLYVAMTRAEERLYISGYYRKRQPNDLAWSQMIASTLGGDFTEVPAFWDAATMILRRETDDAILPDRVAAPDVVAASAIDVPAFLTRPVPREFSPLPPLKPSSALAAADADFGEPRRELPPVIAAVAQRRAALEHGRLMHVLLQYLPDAPPATRRAAAEAFLKARAPDFDAVHRADFIDRALSVLELPALVDLFGPRARTEVAVAGHVTLPNGHARAVVGQVDRIVETDTDVIVADYKTGVPSTAEATPQAYVTQMALYRAVLAPLWPGKRLRMLLIWTAGPQVVEMSERQLEAALQAFESQVNSTHRLQLDAREPTSYVQA